MEYEGKTIMTTALLMMIMKKVLISYLMSRIMVLSMFPHISPTSFLRKVSSNLCLGVTDHTVSDLAVIDVTSAATRKRKYDNNALHVRSWEPVRVKRGRYGAMAECGFEWPGRGQESPSSGSIPTRENPGSTSPGNSCFLQRNESHKPAKWRHRPATRLEAVRQSAPDNVLASRHAVANREYIAACSCQPNSFQSLAQPISEWVLLSRLCPRRLCESGRRGSGVGRTLTWLSGAGIEGDVRQRETRDGRIPGSDRRPKAHGGVAIIYPEMQLERTLVTITSTTQLQRIRQLANPSMCGTTSSEDRHESNTCLQSEREESMERLSTAEKYSFNSLQNDYSTKPLDTLDMQPLDMSQNENSETVLQYDDESSSSHRMPQTDQILVLNERDAYGSCVKGAENLPDISYSSPDILCCNEITDIILEG
ncbi:hypothetical protein PR048_023635 [Dryococelus australis]|uniref:Uncharacterized protein n=1 Tax=Dryococelus australis TaxID=614101 RepID=A0ABQ9GUQ1_9NEOP|nr:hypothetical protein PR048_023635 [Dryococelus australis]